MFSQKLKSNMAIPFILGSNNKTNETNETNETNKTEIWVEKYRPTNFDDIVLDPINHTLFKNILEMNYFPNLLFYGPPGTGKTTTIINLINEYQKKYSKINTSTVIHLNASDERGIDIIRNQINQFVKSMNIFETGLKFVVLDEVDYMTKNAQQALKYILQTSTYNVRFCLICNYITKIDESLKNEFICIRFNQLPKQYIMDFLKNISIKENLQLTNETIQSIQNMFQSDMRSMINFIQLNQNLNINEWEYNIITNAVFENFHHFTLNGENTMNHIICKIHEISIQYNTDKKTFLLKYFNYIIRHHTELITTEFMNKIENVVHDTGNVPIEIIIRYFFSTNKEGVVL
jgi:replication factor C subunit 3/5